MNKYTIYKNNIIEALENLSSYEFQSVAWFDNDNGLSYSYNENVMDLFYDSTLDDALKSGHFVFSKEADHELIHLEHETSLLDDDNYNAITLLNSPQMQIVREKAAEALALVLASDGSESTVEIIED
jgi:hypothetical protein